MKSIPAPAQFSFEDLASEVNSVVEDLRWLHLELSFRNHLNEIIFQEIDSIDTLLKIGLQDIRTRLGVLEASAYTHERTFIRQAFRDIDPDVLSGREHPPWLFEVEDVFRVRYPENEPARATIIHYTVDKMPLTALIMPIVLGTEALAAILLLLPTNTLIPRIRHFATSIAKPLGISIDYLLNSQKLRSRSRELETRVGERTAELEWTHNFLVKLVDSTDMLIMACDKHGSVIIWNKAAEELTGVDRADMKTFTDFLGAIGITREEAPIYHELIDCLHNGTPLPNFEISASARGGDRRVISWTHSTLMTEKGAIVLEFGRDVTETSKLLERIISYEKDVEAAIHARYREISADHATERLAVENSGMLLLGLDHEGRLLYGNRAFFEATSWQPEEILRRSFSEQIIVTSYVEQVRYIFDALRRAGPGSVQHGRYQLRTRGGKSLSCDWQHVRMRGEVEDGPSIWLFGFIFSETEEAFQATGAPRDRTPFVSTAPDAKLSQRYRFLMKYVPFPLLHLDEENRIINANPAFQDLVGFQIQYGTPLSDFAAFEVHHPVSDPAPCNLFILSREGITMTYRGITTMLSIYGKSVREITIDL